MAEKSLFRTGVMVVFASFASLSAEAWLRAGENSEPPSPENIALDQMPEMELSPVTDDEFQLPDETVGVITANLKVRLEKDLHVRLPADFEFVDRVVEMVENGTLSFNLVNRCYLWARKQPNFQFQHFRQAVRKQARVVGVVI
jgi:hypothetical protein